MGLERYSPDSHSPEPDYPQVRKDLYQIAHLPWVRDALKQQEATWLAQPSGLGLSLAFAKKGPGKELIGVDLFGVPNCVGVKVCQETRFDGVTNGLEDDPRIGSIRNQGGYVAVLTRQELREWVVAYQHLQKYGLWEKIGSRALKLPGFRRASETEAVGYRQQLLALLKDNWEYFADCGVTRIEPQKGFDLAFLNDQGDLVPVPLYNLRQPRGNPAAVPLLSEKITQRATQCAGLILRQPNESKRTAYLRRRQALEANDLSRTPVKAAVISSGQLSLWRKLGMTNPLRNVLPETAQELPVSKVLKHLILGGDTAHPGELAQLGLSLPGSGHEFGADIVFWRRDEKGNLQPASISGLAGLDLRKLKRGDFGLIPVANVGGIIIFPDNWSPNQMKEHAKLKLIDFHYRTRTQGNLLYLTRSLFEVWQERGSIFATEAEEGELRQEPQRAFEYGYGFPEANFALHIWRDKIRGPEIGGSRIALSQESSGHKIAWHFDDLGASFHDWSALSSLTATPSTALGFFEQFRWGQIPMIPGAYDRTYLLASALNSPSVFAHHDPSSVEGFLTAELAHRVPREELIEVLGPERTQTLLDLAPQDEAAWYQGGDAFGASGSPSHAHWDHLAGYSSFDRNIPLYASTETVAHAKALSARASSWRGEIDQVCDILHLEGRSYPRFPRPLYPLDHSGDAFQSGQLKMTTGLVNHSLTGASMRLYETPQGSVLNTGDFKAGLDTEATVDMFSGRADLIIIESTKSQDEGGGNLTEEEVAENISQLIRQRPGRLIIAVAPSNHLERLGGILRAARDNRRLVAVSYKHAEMIQQMRVARMQAPGDADGFHFELPQIGEEVALWQKTGLRPRGYQRVLLNLAAQGKLGIINEEIAGQKAGELIIVVDPFQLLPHHFGRIAFGERGPSVIHSAPFPHQSQNKSQIGLNRYWAVHQAGGEYLADYEVFGQGGRVLPSLKYGIHASGHVNFQQMSQDYLPRLIGDHPGKVQIIVNHGEHPERYAQALKQHLGSLADRVEIIASLRRYDPHNPLAGGHFGSGQDHFRLQIA